MKAIELSAKWSPKPGFKLGSKDIDGKLTYLGSQVWKDPVVKIVERENPKINFKNVNLWKSYLYKSNTIYRLLTY